MTIRVFASGQSNMLGRDPGGPSWATISAQVRVWDNTNSLGANGTAFTTATDARANHGTFLDTDKNNLAIWFCDRVARDLGEDVDFTLVARGGTRIENWALGGGPEADMLQECIDVWTVTGQDPAHVFLWQQGEGDDADATYASYSAAFLDLLSNLTSAGVIDANTVVIIGGLAETFAGRIAFNRDVLEEIAKNTANVFYARSDGLEVYDTTTHYTGQSLYAFGHDRFFEAYAASQGFSMPDLYALVNEGGTPGTPGTGTPKLFNLKSLAEIGLNAKDITTAPDYAGVPDGANLLIAGMLAASASVEFGTDGTNGSYLRLENGIQICWNKMAVAYANSSTLLATWTFEKEFLSTAAAVLAIPNNSPSLAIAKRYGGFFSAGAATAGTATVVFNNASAFVSGDELGVTVFAIGWWK